MDDHDIFHREPPFEIGFVGGPFRSFSRPVWVQDRVLFAKAQRRSAGWDDDDARLWSARKRDESIFDCTGGAAAINDQNSLDRAAGSLCQNGKGNKDDAARNGKHSISYSAKSRGKVHVWLFRSSLFWFVLLVQ